MPMQGRAPEMAMENAGAVSGAGFFDLHNHILWDVDDGASSPVESLELVRGLMRLGFVGAAPSPHSWSDRAECAARLNGLRELLAQNALSFSLAENAENVASPEDVMALLDGRGRTVAGGRWFLMELPLAAPVPALPNILAMIARSNHSALIAHPERCLHFQAAFDAAFEALDAGAFLQLDVMSLAGAYGRRVQRLAEELLDESAYAVAATDIHSTRDLPALTSSLFRLRERVPDDEVTRLLTANPQRVLTGQAQLL